MSSVDVGGSTAPAPGPSSDALIALLERALEHPRPRNRHARRFLRLTQDATTARTASELLANYNACQLMFLDAMGDLYSYDFAEVFRRCQASGLVTKDELTALFAALDSAIRLTIGGPAPVSPEARDALANDPSTLARASYALARDLAAFE